MTTKIGKMRDLLEIQNLVKTPDGRGGNVEVPTKVGEEYAEVRPASATEVLRYGAEQHAIVHRVTMRYTDLIQTDSRLVLEGTRILSIEGKQNLRERDRFLRMVCVEATK